MSEERENTRRYFIDVWKKQQAGQILQPLEALIADVIATHPEYHSALEDNPGVLEANFDVASGQSNPFLHMGMHITIKEQYGTDRPAGFRTQYDRGIKSLGDAHTLEHRIMECLGEVLWRAQRDQTSPDEQAYLLAVRQMIDSL